MFGETMNEEFSIFCIDLIKLITKSLIDNCETESEALKIIKIAIDSELKSRKK